MTDLFDITNVDDLPEDLAKKIKPPKRVTLADQVMELLHEAPGPISTRQLSAALWRKYRRQSTNINATLSRLISQDAVKRAGSNMYTLKKR